MSRLLALLAVLAVHPAIAADYYAKPAATGSGNCASLENACSLTKLVSKLKCGDTGYVADGNYAAVSIDASANCVGKATMTLRAMNPQGAVLTGKEPTSQGAPPVIEVFGGNVGNIVIGYFKIVVVADAFGIQLRAVKQRDITIDHVEIELRAKGGTGIWVPSGGVNLVVQDSYLHKSRPEFAGKNDGSAAFAIDIYDDAHPSTGLILRRNHIKDWWGGVTIKNSTQVSITDNVFENIHDHTVKPVDVNGLDFFRNVWWQSSKYGLYNGDVMATWCSANVRAYNNTAVGGGFSFPVIGTMPSCDAACGGGPNCAGIKSDGRGPQLRTNQNDGLILANNIISGGDPRLAFCVQLDAARCSTADCVYDRANIYFECVTGPGSPDASCPDCAAVKEIAVRWGDSEECLARWQARPKGALWTGVSPCAECLSSDPKFVDAAAGNFKLQPSSPARDSGDDAHCANTVVGAHCDIGAFEWAGSTSP